MSAASLRLPLASGLAALIAALAAAPARAQGFSGTASGPGGATSGASGYTYDTGNGVGTILDQGTANGAGLGSANGAGVFTPAPGAGGVLTVLNNGAYTVWCFPNVKICVKDSNKKECCFTETVYVPANLVGGNAAINENIISEHWINGVKACMAGAGATAKGYWNPGWTPPAAATSTSGATDSKTGETKKTVPAPTTGSSGQVKTVRYVYKTACAYSFLPQYVADTLGLTPLGSVDITADLATQAQLGTANMNQTGQMVFQRVFVPSLDLGVGVNVSGEFLVSKDANSDFGILGANIINSHHLYAHGVTVGGTQDMLAYCFGTAIKYGQGCAGAGGFVSDLGIDGCMSPGGTFTLHLEGGLGGSLALLVIGAAQTNLPLGYGCSLLVDPIINTLALPLTGSGAGQGEFSYDIITPPTLPPFVLTAQAAVIDAEAPLGYSVSNAVLAEVE